MKVKELIELINNAKLYSLWDADELIHNDVNLVECYLNSHSHELYDLSTNIYKCDDGYVGVEGLFSLKSENMNYIDCGISCSASEFIAIPTITYKQKNINYETSHCGPIN